LPNGTECSTGSNTACSESDSCQYGICRPGGGGDEDGDDVCEIDDNCPIFGNSNQSDVDDDGDGDFCDARDADLHLTRAHFRLSEPPRLDSGRIQIRGSFERPELTPFDVEGGVAASVWVAGNGPLEIIWRDYECRSSPDRAVCKTSAGDATLHAAKLPPSSHGVPRSSLLINVRNLGVGPLPPGPVDVVLSNAPGVRYFGIDRVARASGCMLRRRSLSCRSQ